MKALQTPAGFVALVGQPRGTSDWFTIEQRHIDDFARNTSTSSARTEEVGGAPA